VHLLCFLSYSTWWCCIIQN